MLQVKRGKFLAKAQNMELKSNEIINKLKQSMEVLQNELTYCPKTQREIENTILIFNIIKENSETVFSQYEIMKNVKSKLENDIKHTEENSKLIDELTTALENCKIETNIIEEESTQQEKMFHETMQRYNELISAKQSDTDQLSRRIEIEKNLLQTKADQLNKANEKFQSTQYTIQSMIDSTQSLDIKEIEAKKVKDEETQLKFIEKLQEDIIKLRRE